MEPGSTVRQNVARPGQLLGLKLSHRSMTGRKLGMIVDRDLTDLQRQILIHSAISGRHDVLLCVKSQIMDDPNR